MCLDHHTFESHVFYVVYALSTMHFEDRCVSAMWSSNYMFLNNNFPTKLWKTTLLKKYMFPTKLLKCLRERIHRPTDDRATRVA